MRTFIGVAAAALVLVGAAAAPAHQGNRNSAPGGVGRRLARADVGAGERGMTRVS